VKNESPSTCATVNWKVCESAIALYLSVIKRTCNRSTYPIIRTRTRYFRHAYAPTHDNIFSAFNYIPKSLQQERHSVTDDRFELHQSSLLKLCLRKQVNDKEARVQFNHTMIFEGIQ
jgi:hypothetical protein